MSRIYSSILSSNYLYVLLEYHNKYSELCYTVGVLVLFHILYVIQYEVRHAVAQLTAVKALFD